MTERITIKDIAKALDIHHSTVSRALRNDNRVKDETSKRINQYAQKYGYQTNRIALELRGQKRKTLAVIVPNINHQFFATIVSYVANLAMLHDMVVSVFQSNEKYTHEVDIIDTIIQYNFAGVLASMSMESKEVHHFNTLKRHNIPLVMFDRVGYKINVPKVIINNCEIMRQAIALLFERGHKRIAHISGPTHLNVFSERQRGYRMGLQQFNLDYEKIIIVNKAFSIDDGNAVTIKLFEGGCIPDAIISDSSNLLYGLIAELRKRHLKIPDDITLMAFGENSTIKVVDSSIIVIQQPEEEIARTAFQLLLDKIENKNTDKNESIVLSANICFHEKV